MVTRKKYGKNTYDIYYSKRAKTWLVDHMQFDFTGKDLLATSEWARGKTKKQAWENALKEIKFVRKYKP